MTSPSTRTLLLTLLFAVTAGLVKAQEFGGNPPSLKWRQVNIPAAKVIFPLGLDSAALRVANVVQQINGRIQSTIGFKQKQVSIVLQNQTTVANAYVGLAPFRSEFYLTPEQNSFEIGSLPWPEQLAIHEFRHVQQFNNFNVGLSKTLRTLFGEGGQALGNELSVPNWFFEGDAVFNETHVSDQGRGRLPYFLNGYRALWAAGKDYSYMKLRNGSYLDYTPDHYQLGYMLVAYGREKYGDRFWKNVTQDAAAFKGGFYPLQRAVNKHAGINFTDFSSKGLSYFKQQFKPEQTNATPNNQHFIANEEYPAYVNDSTVIYMKTTYDHIPVFVSRTGDKETDISVRSASLDKYFDYRYGKIVYAAYRPDLRWGYRTYNELMLLDVKTGAERRITTRSKYFSPAFSGDGSRIVAVQVNPDGKNELHILNTIDGRLLSVVPGNGDNLFYTYPRFYDKDRLIAAVRNKAGKMSIALIDIASGNTRYLLPFSLQPIAFTSVDKDKVYFTATSGNTDRIFALSVRDSKLYALKSDSLQNLVGNYQPIVSANKLACVSFTAYGYRLHQIDNSNLKWEPTNQIGGGLPGFNITALAKDSAANLLTTVKDEPLKTDNYSKAYRLFNFHSLIPNISDPNYSLALVGENVLNTFQSQLSFTYNSNEGYKRAGFEAIYGALFPYLSAGADYTFDRRGYYKGNNIYFNETELHGGAEVPLNLSQGKHFTGFDFGTDLYYNLTNYQSGYSAQFADRSYMYLNNSISFNNRSQQAKQHIYPRFAQSLLINYKSAISGADARQFLASGSFYFPGLKVSHNFIINVAHQQKNKNSVIDFSNNFPFSKGYTAENLYSLNKIGATYHFPIAYPDAGVANAAYLLRLRGNVFYDYTRGTDFYTNGSTFKGTFRSAGAGISFDTQLFNQVSVTFGIRYSYLIDDDIFGGNGRNRIEIVLPVSFF